MKKIVFVLVCTVISLHLASQNSPALFQSYTTLPQATIPLSAGAQARTTSGCPAVISGPALVNSNAVWGASFTVPAVPLPSTVSCSSASFVIFPSNNSAPGENIFPSMILSYTASPSTATPGVQTPLINGYINGTPMGCGGVSGSGCAFNITAGGSSGIFNAPPTNPNSTYSYSLCETASSSYTTIPAALEELYVNPGGNTRGPQISSFTWTVSDGICQGITLPPMGSLTFTATCGSCLTVSPWQAVGFFDPKQASPGTHTITYQYSKPGCPPYTATHTLTVVNPFDASFTVTSPICQNATCVSLQPTNYYSNYSDSWGGNAGISGNQFCPMAAGGGTFDIAYSVGTAVCRDTVIHPVVVIPIGADAGPDQVLTCSNPTLQLQGAAVPSYSWAGPGIVSGSNTATPVVGQPGTYTLSASNQGCAASSTVTVTQHTAVPTATVSPATHTITCSSPTVSLLASSSSSSATYSWTGPGLTPPVSSGSVAAAQSGTYQVVVTDAVNGCTATATSVIFSNGAIPSAAISVLSANQTLSCTTPQVLLGALVTPSSGITYTWQPSGNSGTNESVTSPGTVSLIAENPATGCTDTAIFVVGGSLDIHAAFTANPMQGPAPLAVNFTNQSTGATSYTWSFGNGTGSTTPNPSQTYSSNGTYQVMLVAQNATCLDTAYATIIVDSPLGLEAPNVFTPNDDGTNDLFFVKTYGAKELQLQIFNRWGNLIFEITDVNAGWDGKESNGSKAVDGVYFYVAKLTGADGKTSESKGTIHLFR